MEPWRYYWLLEPINLLSLLILQLWNQEPQLQQQLLQQTMLLLFEYYLISMFVFLINHPSLLIHKNIYSSFHPIEHSPCIYTDSNPINWWKEDH